ncbi:MAG: hypothetical protein A2X12_06945 [Bacteroidetes bacterium GWE2_29_8]|nr:MAG: hypothetical protein A2X12_06945 [Bacteroidetes bacterium GWE2_29_8]
MKNIILIIGALIIFGNIGYAQDKNTDLREKLKFGLKIGANYSNVYDSEGEKFDADAKLGLATGIFIGIPIGKYLGINPEILFSQKGFQATGRILGSDYKFTRTTNYIDIPIFLALKPIEFVTILLGPQYSFLLKQKDVFTNSLTSFEQEQEFDNDNIRKNTLSVAGGIDINVKHVVVGARLGLDIQNNNGNGTSATPRYKNAWYQVTLGYRF